MNPELFGTPGNHRPLAERMRPQQLGDIIGQEHLTGPNSPLIKAIQAQRIPSILLWGPPGVGKTTFAQVIAHTTERPVVKLSAISSGVKEVREVLEKAALRPGLILFIDEIHRFNKTQQDSLLTAVEQGWVTLIGATTENPSFEIIPALRSRCQIYVLNPLTQDQLLVLFQKAIQSDEVLQQIPIELKETEALYRFSGGDARKALNLLEMVVMQAEERPVVIVDSMVMSVAQQTIAVYDKTGEYHYDIISAFIKSLRGSDPNGALYWMAVMIEGGEDIKFIARRMVILASEDIGNANPNALLLATSGYQAIEKIGMPEARIILSQVATYLATSPKSNASYQAIDAALSFVRTHPQGAVPLHLRNAPTKLMKELGYGKNYKYSHSFEGKEGNQSYLPEEYQGTIFYDPKEVGKEKEIRAFLKNKWEGYYKYE